MIRGYDTDTLTGEETETAMFAFGYFRGLEAKFADVGFERVHLHRLGQAKVAIIDGVERAVPQESS